MLWFGVRYCKSYSCFDEICVGVVTTLAGGYNELVGVAVSLTGTIYVTDASNNIVDMISPTGTGRIMNTSIPIVSLVL